jgi:hypothetical protein
VKWLADENFRNAIIRGLVRRHREFDIVRAQDTAEVAGQDDLILLGYATREGLAVVTHDLSTMIPAAREQLRLASRCAPIVFVPDWIPIGSAVEDLLLIDQCAIEADLAAGVIYLPLR